MSTCYCFVLYVGSLYGEFCEMPFQITPSARYLESGYGDFVFRYYGVTHGYGIRYRWILRETHWRMLVKSSRRPAMLKIRFWPNRQLLKIEFVNPPDRNLTISFGMGVLGGPKNRHLSLIAKTSRG